MNYGVWKCTLNKCGSCNKKVIIENKATAGCRLWKGPLWKKSIFFSSSFFFFKNYCTLLIKLYIVEILLRGFNVRLRSQSLESLCLSNITCSQRSLEKRKRKARCRTRSIIRAVTRSKYIPYGRNGSAIVSVWGSRRPRETINYAKWFS